MMRRVLLMDDDEDLCVLATRMAGRIGVEIEWAANADETVAAFVAARTSGVGFDAVILDATIPGGRGAAEVVGELKALAPATPVIVTSGWSDGDLLRNYRAHGFSQVLAKPFDRERFAEVLSELLGPTGEP